MHYAKLKIFLQYDKYQNYRDFWLLKYITFQIQLFYRFHKLVHGFSSYMA